MNVSGKPQYYQQYLWFCSNVNYRYFHIPLQLLQMSQHMYDHQLFNFVQQYRSSHSYFLLFNASIKRHMHYWITRFLRVFS